MPTSSPLRAFAAGQAARKHVTLRQGLFKLRQALGELDRVSSTIARIEDKISRGKKFHEGELLGMCTPEDKAGFLKQVPAILAETMGYTVLPAIAALPGDGVSNAAVAKIADQAKAEVDLLLHHCERVHALLKQGIQHEYDAMRCGGSRLWPIISHAESIVRDAINQAEAAKHA